MAESPGPRTRAAFLLLAGMGLAALAGFGGIAAAVAAWAAQPLLGIGIRLWRTGQPDGWSVLRRDLHGPAVLWGVGGLGAATLVAWPMQTLLAAPSLGATAALSTASALVLIGLWRTWPLWQAVERDGGSLAAHWRGLGDRDASGWLGLVAALVVGLVLAGGLVLAWPGLLTPPLRWVIAAVLVLAWPALHLVLQRLPVAAQLPLQIVDMTGAEPDPGDGLLDVAGDATTALYAAARSGRVDQALGHLERGADAHALPAADDRDQRALPVLAAVLPDLRLLRALIAAGVDLNAAHAGMTPLLAATRDSWHGRPDAVMTLLANGADPRAADVDGNTPLHHAARSSDPGVAALLRDAAGELDVANQDGITPLGIACACGNWRLARFLLERGARPQPGDGSPALLAAAGGDEDDAAGVELLLKHKARVDGRGRDGRTALHEAAFAGHVEIVAALLAAHADVHARDTAQRTPLLDAVRGGRTGTFESLLAAGADPLAVDEGGANAVLLACAAEAASATLLRRLLELGVPADAVGADGRRAVDHAAAAGRWAFVSALDPGYVLPASVAGDLEAEAGDAPDRTPLALVRNQLREERYDDLERLASLLSPAELGGLLVDPDAPLSASRIEWLLAHGADPEAVADAGNGEGLATILLARGPDAVPALQVLLRRGIAPSGDGGLGRFLQGCARDEQAGRALEQFALELLDHGIDATGVVPGGDPPLSLAVRLGWLLVMERLVEIGADLDARDSHGMTALHLCAALARESALKLLVRHGASPSVRAADGQTPLGVALSAGRRDLADWLDWRGWPLPLRPLVPEDVPAAAMVGDADAVRRLLDLGMAVDAVDALGCTGLLRASGGGHRDALELLLERGADPQHAAHTGATPLSAAVSMRQGEIVERLLSAGAKLEQRLPGDVTVLMLAAALGLPDVCARLLGAGANVQAADAQGLTPLHCATLFGFTARERPRLLALLDTLLLAGAEADAAAAGGVTPLLLLLGARAEPGTACDEDVVLAALERLLDEEVTLEAQDPRGFGPLHLASLHGLLGITRRLLRAGCEPGLRDALNRTPREIAVMRGFIDVAAEFAPVQSGVSMARFLREPR